MSDSFGNSSNSFVEMVSLGGEIVIMGVGVLWIGEMKGILLISCTRRADLHEKLYIGRGQF